MARDHRWIPRPRDYRVTVFPASPLISGTPTSSLQRAEPFRFTDGLWGLLSSSFFWGGGEGGRVPDDGGRGAYSFFRDPVMTLLNRGGKRNLRPYKKFKKTKKSVFRGF